MHGYGKLRRCTEKLRAIVDFYLFLAAALVVIRQRIQRARRRYRWATRPTSRRLKERLLSVALNVRLCESARMGRRRMSDSEAHQLGRRDRLGRDGGAVGCDGPGRLGHRRRQPERPGGAGQ